MAGSGQFPKSKGDIIYHGDVDGGYSGRIISHSDWPLTGPHSVGAIISHSDPYITTTLTWGGGFLNDVRSWAVSNGWDQYGPLVVNITGDVVSTSVGNAAIYINGNFPLGLTLNIGSGIYVAGYGGNGGSAPGTAGTGGNGSGGGNAIVFGSLTSRGPIVTINNQGYIGGGGGGGGAGGTNVSSGKGTTTYYQGGGGGGGAAYGSGGSGINNGGNASETTGGAGGAGDGSHAGGGNGGSLGSAGSNGGSIGSYGGGSGGTAGNAIAGSSGWLTLNNSGPGTTYGAIS
jgi:hypothetical protein